MEFKEDLTLKELSTLTPFKLLSILRNQMVKQKLEEIELKQLPLEELSKFSHERVRLQPVIDLLYYFVNPIKSSLTPLIDDLCSEKSANKVYLNLCAKHNDLTISWFKGEATTGVVRKATSYKYKGMTRG